MNEIEEMFPFYALGVLSADEKAKVEVYVATNPSAKTRLNEMVQTAQALPLGVAPTPPSRSVKTSLIARVREDAQARKPNLEPVRGVRNGLYMLRRWLASPGLMVVTATVALLLGVWVGSLRQTVNNLVSENTALQALVVMLEDENNFLRERQIEQNEVLALLSAPNRGEFPINGTEFQPEAVGTLFVAAPEGRDAVFLASNLPALPLGLVYQFWLIGEDGPIGTGLFQVNSQGQGVLIVQSEQSVLSFEAAGVSIEPDGGSEQPTGNIVLLGMLSEN
ncbi:MAG: hypothetical protein HC806_07900 [Anaerolineae bacterium]|nr:hypothetical protein [Anaerolineae bacterium]